MASHTYKSDSFKHWARYLLWCFPFLIFLFHTYPMGLSDYWWHMSNGRWIWENMNIPSVDPFTYSYAKDDDIRRVVILKAYYLGQLSFYTMYSLFGIWGLLLYKAVLLTIPYIILLRHLQRRHVNTEFAVLILCPLPFILFRLDELRPHIFSFIGAILVFYLIEKIMDDLKLGKTFQKYWLFLPTTMLAWANLHRGFIIGWVILTTYLFFELINYFRNKNSLPLPQLKILLFFVCASIIVTLLNPNGLYAFIANFVELKGPFMQVIDEYFPLWNYSKLYQSWQIFFGCAAIVVFSAYFLIRSRKNVQAAHIFLALGFSYEGFSTFRFSPFLCFLLLAITAPYYQKLSHKLFTKYKKTFIPLLIVSLGTLGYVSYLRTAFLREPTETAYFPYKTVDYILKNRPPANLFNAFEYGGYFSWELYPHYKIFIDQRNLDFSVYEEYGKAWNGNYEQVFQKYNINTVAFYITQPVLTRTPGIVNKLLFDNNWEVVYLDKLSIVFVRKSRNPGLPVYNKTRVANYVKNISIDSKHR